MSCSESSLSSGVLSQMEDRSPLEAKVYRSTYTNSFNNNDIKTIQIIDKFARLFLQKLRAHPYVAIHGNGWKKHFSIESSDNDLEAIRKIYSCLHETIMQRSDNSDVLYPRLRMDEFHQLYLSDLFEREKRFYKEIFISLESFGRNQELIKEISCFCKESTSQKKLILKIIEKLKEKGMERLLWEDSAEANYWEIIPSLFKHVSPKGNIFIREENLDWEVVFNKEMKKRPDYRAIARRVY